jgi:hypothetical protein
MRREQLLASSKLPFDDGPDVLFTSYSAVAELSCFLELGWSPPRNVLCSYAECCDAINGLDIDGLTKKRPKLREACELYGLPHMSAGEKAHMIDLIINKHQTEWTETDWQEIERGNKNDVLQEMALLEVLAPTIDLEAALFRGRYSKAVTPIEANGLPIYTEYLNTLVEHWPELKRYYIRRDDNFGLYDDNGSFNESRFFALIENSCWAATWPRTPTGLFAKDSKTFGKQCKHHPELRPLQKLRDQIAELRLGAFLNTIGADGASRISTLPFWTVTGRNQPSAEDKAFLLSLPSWVHGLIKPAPGWGIALLDWSGQEIGIGAALSGDPMMIADFQSGDPHMRFAIRAGLAPVGATAQTHAALRDAVKPLVHGASYGMSKYGAAAATGKSLLWSAETLARHRHTYPIFTQWQQNVVTQAIFDGRIVSPLGWPMAVHAGTPKRTLMNFMQQAAGADCMRLAAIAGHEAGIRICAVVHDAFWITAPLGELDDAIETMRRFMVRASAVVTGGLEIPVKVSARVRWPQCLGDVREAGAKGQGIWAEIAGLVRGDALRRAGGVA